MKHLLRSSVGKGGNNGANDVKLAQALLNVYLRREGKKTLPITGKCDAEVISAIENFQKNEQKIPKPNGRIDASGRTLHLLKAVKDRVLRDNLPMITPAEGIVTFDSEGNEGGLFHSRILHVPTGRSGLTLGRGYDMKEKPSAKIYADLVKAGVDTKFASIISKASSLFGATAEKFIIDNDLIDFRVTPLMQKALFDITYADESKLAEHACKQKDYAKVYGECNWDKLNQAIKEMVIDLKFRGDYRKDTAEYIQEHIVNNDFKAFSKVMSDRILWKKVPNDRFERRKKFLQSAKAE